MAAMLDASEPSLKLIRPVRPCGFSIAAVLLTHIGACGTQPNQC